MFQWISSFLTGFIFCFMLFYLIGLLRIRKEKEIEKKKIEALNSFIKTHTDKLNSVLIQENAIYKKMEKELRDKLAKEKK